MYVLKSSYCYNTIFWFLTSIKHIVCCLVKSQNIKGISKVHVFFYAIDLVLDYNWIWSKRYPIFSHTFLLQIFITGAAKHYFSPSHITTSFSSLETTTPIPIPNFHFVKGYRFLAGTEIDDILMGIVIKTLDQRLWFHRVKHFLFLLFYKDYPWFTFHFKLIWKYS